MDFSFRLAFFSLRCSINAFLSVAYLFSLFSPIALRLRSGFVCLGKGFSIICRAVKDQEVLPFMSSSMAESVEALQRRIDYAIESQMAPPETSYISELLAASLALDNSNEELRLLDYRWQTYLDKQYVQSRHLDEFLEGLVQHLLKKKPDRPLEELLLYLESERKQ
ncbi:hypothetical protein CUR178_00204 [Leishmania enriettii]|uniref:Uncharacterized protein n=1 Tax=Leishmania enriettii TaxID=5663 RepID=A0A836K711_LEIEN|nr:hypothetical protein CUR178_00204 [Leishmania enriettii]